MNCANFRRNLSDSWLTFTTNIRDKLSWRLALWSCAVWGDPEDADEWLYAVARPVATRGSKAAHDRFDALVKEHGLPGGPAVPETWERKEDMAVTFSNVDDFDKWNRGLNPALLEHVKATKDE